MKTKKFNIRIATWLLILLFVQVFTGCSKYLDKTPDQTLVIPKTVADAQSLLDNNYIFNTFSLGQGEASSDNYYLPYDTWLSLSDNDRNIYTWGDEIIGQEYPNSWSNLYQSVYYANVVMETLDGIDKSQDGSSWNNAYGEAFFFRARAFYITAGYWCNAYDSLNAETDLGIPLRLTSDFNETTTRASLSDTYAQIIEDLRSSIDLLPITPSHVMRPSRPAAFALLARVCLSIADYPNALKYADSSLALKNDLMDYNEIANRDPYSYLIAPFNKEVIFHSHGYIAPLDDYKGRIDSVLYAQYVDNDLRKSLFFYSNSDGSHSFRGSYFGSFPLFNGIAVDEVLLTKAECEARMNKGQEAISDLNSLLVKRWKTGTFTPYTYSNSADALSLILYERRKELVMRDLHWIDLKRLNRDGANIGISRILNGKEYTLAALSPKWALPIPQIVIDQSGIKQNSRQ